MNKRNHLIAMGIYFAVFCLLTFPLIAHFSSAIIGSGDADAPIFIWNVFQLGYNLAHHLPLWTDSLTLAPNNFPLILHTYTPVFSALTLLFNLLAGNLILSFNLVFLLSTIAGAYFAYRFLLYLTGSEPASLFGGLAFGFQPIWSIYAIFGTQNMLSLCYISAALFFYEHGMRKMRMFWHVITGLVLGLSLLNDFNMGIFTFTAFVLWAFYRELAIERSYSQDLIKRGLIIFAGALPALLALSFQMYTYRDFIRQMPLPSISDVDYYGADPINLLRPTHFHPILGRFAEILGDVNLWRGNAWLGFSLLIVIVAVIIFRKNISLGKKQFWGIFSAWLVLVIFSWGPYLNFFGIATHLPLPYLAAIKIFPQIANLRMPMRWLIPAGFFLACWISLLLAALLRKLRRKSSLILAGLLSLLFIFEVGILPRPLLGIEPSDRQVLEELAAINTGTVLELPLSINSGYWSLGSTSRIALWHQLFHQRPTVNGHLSRLNHEVESSYLAEPVMSYLLTWDQNAPSAEDLLPEHVAAFEKKYDASFLIVDRNELSGDAGQRLMNYLRQTLAIKKLSSGASLDLYKIQNIK